MSAYYWADLEVGGYYHIYNRAVTNGQRLFLHENHYRFFLRRWDQRINPYIDLLAYCLIPNHFHFIIHIPEPDEETIVLIQRERTVAAQKYLSGGISYREFLESQFQRFFLSFAKSMNRRRDRYGSLFQKRYKRVRIKTAHRLLELIHYVHHNPIHHRLRNDFYSWRYSSYRAILSGQPTKISREQVLCLYDTQDVTLACERFLEAHKRYRREWVITGFRPRDLPVFPGLPDDRTNPLGKNPKDLSN